nr:MAG TPA: hypothetical protein [Caudoviricetes sp.]
MSTLKWAENEIEIVRNNLKNSPEEEKGENDYILRCYESALKAFKSLVEDQHSGMSISITKSILIRLIEGRPLNDIQDADEVWNEVDSLNKELKEYQCSRMSSLFKKVYPDGSVKYNDIDRAVCVNVDDPRDVFHGYGCRILDEMLPIEMPYSPSSKQYKIYCKEFLYDEDGGDFDTLGVLYAISPEGEQINIGRYFKDAKDEPSWLEIQEDEYFYRMYHQFRRKTISEMIDESKHDEEDRDESDEAVSDNVIVKEVEDAENH